MQVKMKYRVLLVLGLMGLVFAILAGLSEHVSWLQFLCSSITDGCRQTTDFTLFSLPLWIWGVVFYIALLLVILVARNWVFWLVGGSVGVEGALVWLMISTKALCIFCLANLLVVIMLIVFSFERERFWQAFSMGLLLFLIMSMSIFQGNKPALLLSSVTAPPPPKEEAAPFVAKAGGEAITPEQLEPPISGRIFDLQMEIHQLKQRRLDELLSEIVIRKEAEQRAISPQQLINQEVASKGIEVSDKDVDNYYQQNRERLTGKGTEAEIKLQIRGYLGQQKRYQMVTDYAKSLYPKYGVVINLEAPERRGMKIKIGSSPALGPPEAPVTVVEFSDYQCPACRAAHEVVKNVRNMYQGRIRWIFKDYPLKMHKGSDKMAQAARCAAEQGKFWEYQDVLYASREEVTPELMERYAAQFEMNADQFKQCIDTEKYKTQVDADIDEASKVGVDRTPTFVVNGKFMTGGARPERFKEVIDEELAKVEGKPGNS